MEVYAGRLVVELYHLDDVALPEPVEAGAVGDHWLVQLADLTKSVGVTLCFTPTHVLPNTTALRYNIVSGA